MIAVPYGLADGPYVISVHPPASGANVHCVEPPQIHVPLKYCASACGSLAPSNATNASEAKYVAMRRFAKLLIESAPVPLSERTHAILVRNGRLPDLRAEERVDLFGRQTVDHIVGHVELENVRPAVPRSRERNVQPDV